MSGRERTDPALGHRGRTDAADGAERCAGIRRDRGDAAPARLRIVGRRHRVHDGRGVQRLGRAGRLARRRAPVRAGADAGPTPSSTSSAIPRPAGSRSGCQAMTLGGCIAVAALDNPLATPPCRRTAPSSTSSARPPAPTASCSPSSASATTSASPVCFSAAAAPGREHAGAGRPRRRRFCAGAQQLGLRHERDQRRRLPATRRRCARAGQLRRAGLICLHAERRRPLQRPDGHRHHSRRHPRVRLVLQLPGRARGAQPRGERDARPVRVVRQLRDPGGLQQPAGRARDDRPRAVARRQAALRLLAVPVRRRRGGRAVRRPRRRLDRAPPGRLLELLARHADARMHQGAGPRAQPVDRGGAGRPCRLRGEPER